MIRHESEVSKVGTLARSLSAHRGATTSTSIIRNYSQGARVWHAGITHIRSLVHAEHVCMRVSVQVREERQLSSHPAGHVRSVVSLTTSSTAYRNIATIKVHVVMCAVRSRCSARLSDVRTDLSVLKRQMV